MWEVSVSNDDEQTNYLDIFQGFSPSLTGQIHIAVFHEIMLRPIHSTFRLNLYSCILLVHNFFF